MKKLSLGSIPLFASIIYLIWIYFSTISITFTFVDLYPSGSNPQYISGVTIRWNGGTLGPSGENGNITISNKNTIQNQQLKFVHSKFWDIYLKMSVLDSISQVIVYLDSLGNGDDSITNSVKVKVFEDGGETDRSAVEINNSTSPVRTVSCTSTVTGCGFKLENGRNSTDIAIGTNGATTTFYLSGIKDSARIDVVLDNSVIISQSTPRDTVNSN